MSDSIKDNYLDLEEFAKYLQEKGKEKFQKDKKENRQKALNKLKFGIMFAIISPFIGIPMGVLLLSTMHRLMESINQFR